MTVTPPMDANEVHNHLMSRPKEVATYYEWTLCHCNTTDMLRSDWVYSHNHDTGETTAQDMLCRSPEEWFVDHFDDGSAVWSTVELLQPELMFDLEDTAFDVIDDY